MATRQTYRAPVTDVVDFDALMARLQEQGEAADPEAQSPKGRTAIRAAADTGLEVASGAVKGIKFMSDVFGADNAVSTALDDVSKFAKSLQSAQAQGEDARMAQIMKEAEDKGIWEQVKAAASAVSEAPIRQSIGAVATGLPIIAASMVPGMREAAWGTRLATMGGLGAAQGVGMVKSSMRDAVYQRAIKEGRSQQEAAALADQAQSYQENPGQIALGGLMGGAATATGFAPAMVRALSPVGANAAKTMSMPTIGKALGMGVLKEVPMESAQGGHEQLAGNVAQNSAGFATPLGRGVAGSAAMEGMLSAPGGTVGGAFDYRSDRADFKAQQSEAAAAAQAEAAAAAAAAAIRANKQPGSGPLTNAVNAGTEADAQKVEVAGASTAAAIASAPDLADTTSSITLPEGSAEFVNPDFQTRQQTLAEQMANPENREKVRARFGDDGLNQVLYYAQAAGRADIPAKTADNMLQVAERMMGEVLLQPLGGDAQLGGMVRDPLTLDAPEQTGAQPLGLGLDQTPSGRFTVDAQGNAVPETAAQQTEAELRAESLRDEQKLKDDEAAILGQQQTGVRNAPEAPLQPVRRTLTDTNTANMMGTASDPVSGLVTQRRLDADAATQRKVEEDQRRFEQARSGTLLNVPETGVTQRPLSVERGMELVNAKANGRTLLPQDEGFLVALRKEMGDDAYARMAQVAKAPFLFKKQERTAILKPNQDAIAAWDAANNQAVADAAQQPGDVLNPSGQPFKTKLAADLAAKKTPGAVVQVVGGFVVRPAPTQAAAPTAPPVAATVAAATAQTTPPAPNQQETPAEAERAIETDAGTQVADLARIWDTENRSSRSDAWFEGAHEDSATRTGFADALDSGGANLRAHGMAKESTLSGGVANLLSLLRNGLDSARGEGRLHYAPLVADRGGPRDGTTPSGSAYADGPFMLVARPGEEFTGNLAGVGAVLVNQSHASLVPALRQAIQAIRPDVMVEAYGQAGNVTRSLNGMAPTATQSTQAVGAQPAGPAAEQEKPTPTTPPVPNQQAATPKDDKPAREAAGIVTATLETNEDKLRFAAWADAHSGKSVQEVQLALVRSEFGPKLGSAEVKQVAEAVSSAGGVVADQARINTQPAKQKSDSEKLASAIKIQKMRVEEARKSAANARDVDQFGLPIENGPKRKFALVRLKKAEDDLAALEAKAAPNQQATPAPEAGPTNQGAKNGQGGLGGTGAVDVAGQSESAQSLTDAPSRLRRIEALNTERSAIARQLEAQGQSIGDDPLGKAIQAATSPLATRDADWLLEALTYSEQTNRTDIAQEVKLRLTELADKLEAESVTDSVTPGVATDNPKYETIAANLRARRESKGLTADAIRARLKSQQAGAPNQQATPAPEAGPTNQGATNGQGQETLLKAEQPTGAAAMVSGAPVEAGNAGNAGNAPAPSNRAEYVAEVRRQLGDLMPGDVLENDMGDRWTVEVVMRNKNGEITGFLPRERNADADKNALMDIDSVGTILFPTPYRDASGNRKMSGHGKVIRANTMAKNSGGDKPAIDAPVAEQPSDTTKPGGFIENVRKAAGKVAPAPVAAQQTAGEAPSKRNQISLGSEDAKSIDQPSKMDGDTVSSLMPFNIAGQKSHLLAESIGGLLETAARTARRVIDAFGGAGTYTHYLRANGIAHDGDILNEFDSMRASAHRQIAKNPDAVKAAVTKFAGEIYAEIERLGLNDGDLFTSDSDAARKALGDWVRSRLEAHVLKEPAPGKTSLTMRDSPELAGMYLVLQKKAVNKIPFQAERTKKTGRIKIPGFLFVMTKGGEKPQGSRVKLGGTVSLFKQDAMVREIHAQIDSAAQRVGGMDVRTGDGWALIANEARDGDLATVDTSYLNKVDLETGKVEETMNYSGDTEEDADPNTYKSKVEKYLLPAWERGAKLLITNNWDDDVAAYLSSQGFDVRKEYRKGAKLEERTTGAAELIAINFDPATGKLTPKNRGRDALAAGVGRSIGGATTGQTQQRGNTDAGANTIRTVAAGAEGQSDTVPRSGRGRLNPSTGAGAGKADSRNSALTSVVRNGGNSTAVLTDIAKNSKNPVFRLVAKAILAKGLPFDLRIRTDFTDGKVAHYSTDGHFVEFDPGMPFNLERVLLHEAVHAVTSKYVASFGDSTPLGKELAALFKLAEQHAKKTGAEFYGLTNADEFLAEVMTNADFAQWLDTVPVPLQKSALSRFVRAVARFFGIQNADGATAQAMDVFERIMLAQSDLQAEASQKLSASKDAAAVADAYGVDTEADGDTVYFGDAEVSLNREDNTYIVSSDNEFTPDHRAAVAWAENNGFTSEFSKSPSANLTPVEAALRDALEATGDMGAAKDMAYEALRRQGVSVKWQEVVDAAKKMGRGTLASKPGVDAIRSDTPASPRTPASTIRAAIAKAYGNLLDKLEAKGLVTIAQTEREAIEAAAQARADKTGGDADAIAGRMMSMAGLDVKYSANGNIEGFFDKQTGKSFLVADNLTAASAPGTLMHEVGIHMAADGKFEPMFDRALTVLNDGSLESTEALRRMQESGETSGEEAAAYLVTVYETNRTNAPASVKQWMKDMIAAVRAWLFSKGVIIKADQLTVADIAAVARANARSMARGGPNGGPGGGRAFSPADPDVRFSRAADMAGNAIDKAKQTADKAMGKDFPRAASMPDLSDDQRSLLGKVGASQSPASDAIKAATDRAGLKIRQGMVDRFAALKELDEKALGQNFIADSITNSAWVLAKMSSAGAGALNAMMKSGRIEMDAQQKVIGLKGAPNGGLTASLQKLGGPAEVERFFAWMAANRSHAIIERNKEAIAKTAEAKRELKNIIEMQAIPGKTAQQVSQLSDARKEWEKIIAKHEPFLDVTERLFTEDEVAAGRTLNTGTTEDGKARTVLYSQVHAEFQQYRDDVLAIAEQAGIINSDNRAMWRDEFYVPFYRVMEDDADRGRSGGNGLSRQEAYKKLKGGRQNLNDLMENTLMNFHHLLSASLKNQAAVQAIKNAEHVGIARKVPEARRDTKTSTFVLVDGKKVFYEVDDPLVFESITTLADTGLNNTAVRVMGAFKRLFTKMTTATPQFIIANTFRDLLQASATSPTGKNIAKNLKEGIQSYRDEKTRAEMLASGGAFSFGHIYGMSADEVKGSLQKTVAGAGLISSPSMIPSILRKGWDKWGDITDLSENASRAATYTQNVDELGKLRAAFEARDVMDFSQHGAWPAVRLLVRIVPFLNARLQGLDKLYRSGLKPSILTAMGKGTDTDKQAAARFAMVTGVLTLATMALYMLNADDDEYKKLEEWQKDTYWFIRIGENAFFLPKPFEVGAIATVAERTLQQAMDDKATGKLFRERMYDMLKHTFAFNPTPQMFQPLIDVYSNKDAFTGRDIESAGMERMSAGLRSRDSTTAPATALSAVSRVFGDESAVAVSPVQADHLIKGYLGGVGATAAGWIDTMYRAATGQSSPDKAWSEYQPIRRFYRDLDVPVANTRYTTLFYDGLKEANRVYADVMELQKLGRTEDAQALATEKRSVLQMRIALNAQQRRLTEINNRMKEVRRSDRDGEWKRRELDLLTTQKALITERLGKRIEDARATQ